MPALKKERGVAMVENTMKEVRMVDVAQMDEEAFFNGCMWSTASCTRSRSAT